MTIPSRHFRRACLAGSIALALAGPSLAPIDASAKSRNDRILAAAEPFEVLTESAFDETPDGLRVLLAEATAALAALGDEATPDLNADLNRLRAELDRALAADDRPGIAIAAVECYRRLVMAQDARARIPREVKLLDYAGFKIDALLKVKPAAWADAAEVVKLANETWAGLSEQIADRKLRHSFAASLEAISAATAAQDARAATVAVKTESDLVDKLEDYFRSKK